MRRCHRLPSLALIFALSLGAFATTTMTAYAEQLDDETQIQSVETIEVAAQAPANDESAPASAAAPTSAPAAAPASEPVAAPAEAPAQDLPVASATEGAVAQGGVGYDPSCDSAISQGSDLSESPASDDVPASSTEQGEVLSAPAQEGAEETPEQPTSEGAAAPVETAQAVEQPSADDAPSVLAEGVAGDTEFAPDMAAFEQESALQTEPDAEPDESLGRGGAELQPAFDTTVVVVIQATANNKVADVTGGSTKNGATIKLHAANSTAAQRFRIVPVAGTDFYVIYCVHSEKVLDVKGGKAAVGTTVQQYSYNGTAAQRWLITVESDGTYLIQSSLATSDGAGLFIGFNEQTGMLELHTMDIRSQILWKLADTRTVADGVYQIGTGVAAGKTLDVKGASLASKGNVQTYASNGSNAQRFVLTYNTKTGYYTITNVASGLVLDVAGGSRQKGANIQQYKSNGTAAQQWSIEQLGSGFAIRARLSGLALDVKGGSQSNGANVQQYRYNGTAAQRWTLTEVAPVADGAYVLSLFANSNVGLDIKGGATTEGANVQFYKVNGTVAQQFEIVRYDGDLYTIRSMKSGLYVVAEGAGAAGTNVSLATGLELTANKLWRIVAGVGGISIVSAADDSQALGGASTNSGANVSLSANSRQATQRFQTTAKGKATAGLNDIVGLVADDTQSVVSRVLSQVVEGKRYLFLPSCTDPTSLFLEYLPKVVGGLAEVATKQAGTYVTLAQGAAIDLTEGYMQDEDGAYVVWLRPSGVSTTTAFYVLLSANIRALFITSDDPINEGRAWVDESPDHSNSATGSMVLLTADGALVYDGGLTQIKGRGNGSWKYDKKPYQIKLDKKTSLLDGTKDNKAKTWVLLANAADLTMSHEYLAKKLALELGLSETPDCEFVDLYYDGVYRGTYLLSEKVQVGDGRIEIEDLEELNEDANGDTSSHDTSQGINAYGYTFQYVTDMVDPEDITGGYLLEIDNGYYQSERCWFESSAGYVVVKSPEDASYNQMVYISEYVQRALNEAALADGDLSAYFDIDSMVRVRLVYELVKDADYLRFSSTFFYKDAGADSVLKTGPVWDVDLSFGSRRSSDGLSFIDPTGMMSESFGFATNNEQYQAALRSVYEEEFFAKALALVEGADGGVGTISELATMISRSYVMNNKIWSTLVHWYTPMTFATQDDAMAYITMWTTARLNWLNWHITDEEEPVVAAGDPLEGTFVVMSGFGTVLDVENGRTDENTNVRLWTSNGSVAQRFTLEAVGVTHTGEWYYTIKNVKSGKLVSLEYADTGSGTSVCIKSMADEDEALLTQYWIVRSISTEEQGLYQIVNLASGLVLDVRGATSAKGANAQVYYNAGTKAQTWMLVA